MNRPREDGKLFFSVDYFYHCWPDGPLGTYADFDFHCLSFHLHLIFMQMTTQVTYTFIPIVSHKDSFCHRGKSKLGIGLFIHELLREPLISFDSLILAFLDFLNSGKFLQWGQYLFVMLSILTHDK